jgi:hypothetical protein
MSAASTPIIVTVSDDMLGKINQVANQLAAKGVTVNRVMPVTGVITGSCDSSKIPVIKNVNGVISVEEEAVALLPPADSRLQ